MGTAASFPELAETPPIQEAVLTHFLNHMLIQQWHLPSGD